MLGVEEIRAFLIRADRLAPFNKQTRNDKGYGIRTIVLLLAILEKEGENQRYFSEFLGWNPPNIFSHTQKLLEGGFIYEDEDERDIRGRAKRLYALKGVREYLQDFLQIEF